MSNYKSIEDAVQDFTKNQDNLLATYVIGSQEEERSDIDILCVFKGATPRDLFTFRKNLEEKLDPENCYVFLSHAHQDLANRERNVNLTLFPTPYASSPFFVLSFFRDNPFRLLSGHDCAGEMMKEAEEAIEEDALRETRRYIQIAEAYNPASHESIPDSAHPSPEKKYRRGIRHMERTVNTLRTYFGLPPWNPSEEYTSQKTSSNVKELERALKISWDQLYETEKDIQQKFIAVTPVTPDSVGVMNGIRDNFNNSLNQHEHIPRRTEVTKQEILENWIPNIMGGRTYAFYAHKPYEETVMGSVALTALNEDCSVYRLSTTVGVNYEGSGIGRLLLQHACMKADEEEITLVDLVPKKHSRMKRMLSGQGFIKNPKQINVTNLQDVMMEALANLFEISPQEINKRYDLWVRD